MRMADSTSVCEIFKFLAFTHRKNVGGLEPKRAILFSRPSHKIHSMFMLHFMFMLFTRKQLDVGTLTFSQTSLRPRSRLRQESYYDVTMNSFRIQACELAFDWPGREESANLKLSNFWSPEGK